ncbi:hypothetical protein FRC01_009512, partial [Tulasnella sp. 417]
MTVLVECSPTKLHHSRRLMITSSEYVYKSTRSLVNLNEDGIKAASKYIHSRMSDIAYAPSTWRTQPLHFIPPAPPATSAAVDAYMAQPAVKRTLDWIFFISAMNFSFWSDRGGEERYGVSWYEDGWAAASADELQSAGLSPTRQEYEALFAPSREEGSTDVETIPLLAERIRVLRRVSEVLCTRFNGSYLGLIEEWKAKYGDDRTALQLVQMVIEEFDDFRDETFWKGKKGATGFAPTPGP